MNSSKTFSFCQIPINVSSQLVLALIFSAVWLIINKYIRKSSSSKHYYPPGPRGWPYVGLIRIPMKKPWFQYVEWGNEYGSDLVHFTRFGRHYLILNSLEAAVNILEKGARITSDRDTTSPLDLMAGWERLLSQMPYSDEWRKIRRLFHQNLRPNASVEYQSIEATFINQFVSELSTSDLFLLDQISTLSQKIMFKTVYGLDIATNKEDSPRNAREIVDSADAMMIPGWNAFKWIPFVHLIPSWVPKLGTHGSAWSKRVVRTLDKLAYGPWKLTMDAVQSNTEHSSLIANLFRKTKSNEDIERLKNMGIQLVAAASDTTMSSIATFFLAMSLYPDVQSKAQLELDTVLGPGKMPTFQDRASLPYIEAIYREVMRWHPALPVGIPHVTTEDVIYKDYLIPQGTTISANIWAMTHNPVSFQDPDKFIPERHLRTDEKPDSINTILAYGFGRRVCVGRYMANDIIWLAIASVLAHITISDAREKDLEECYSDGSLCSPNVESLKFPVHERSGNCSST